MMWGFASNGFSSIKAKKTLSEPGSTCSECSDDEVCSNNSKDEGLECPICWESFNIVENVPYVLWCGHSLCKNCILGLQWAVLKLPTQQIKAPFFISCPWCHLLSFRLVYKGNLKFPRKNYFLLWMVERLNGDRLRSVPSGVDGQPMCSSGCNLFINNHARTHTIRRPSQIHSSGFRSNTQSGSSEQERSRFSLHKSIDYFIHLTSKFPLVILFLLIAFFIVPGSAIVLIIYLILTVVFAVPAFFVLYFAYPTLERLIREITS